MTRENGTDPAKKSEQENLFLIQKGDHLQIVSDFSFTTDRKIRGCAHFPTIDKENELILSEAVKNALPQYMQHPILHLQHTERPVGVVTKAEIDAEGALHIEGSIFDTPDTDDVWADIETGKLNKFSIFGRRDQGTHECKIPPGRRLSPCVTKALTLFSISIVGENAMNPNTFLEVAKGDITPFGEYENFKECTEKNREKENPEAYCASVHEKITGKWPAEKAGEQGDDKPVDAELTQDLRNPSLMQKSIEEFGERLAKIEETLSKLVESDKKVHETMGKSEDEKLTEEKTEETVEKAAVVEEARPEYIVKADMDFEIKKAVDEVRKAYDDKFATIEKAYADLKETVDEMKKETIEKGGHVVIISKDALDANPKIGHLDMIGE